MGMSYGLVEVDDLSFVETAFDAIEAGRLDESSAEEALGACEVLARLNGHRAYEDGHADLWVYRDWPKPPDAMIARANAVIDKILGDARLREEWGDDPDLVESVEELRDRVLSYVEWRFPN